MNKPNVLINVFIILGCVLSFNVQAQQSISQQEISTLLTQAAANVNKQVPMVLDEDTRLDSANTVANMFIYNNTMVNYTVNELDVTTFTKNLQQIVIEPLCDNPSLTIFKQMKVIMVYRYLGKDGEFITEISRNMGECQ